MPIPNRKLCTFILDDGRQCTQIARKDKSCCRKHGNGGRPSNIEKSAPPELRPLIRALPPKQRALVAMAEQSSVIERLRDAATVQESLAAAFLPNVEHIQSSEIIDAAQRKVKVAQDALYQIHEIEYDKKHLISGNDLLGILVFVQESVNKSIRKHCASAHFSEMGDRERLEGLLIADCTDAIRRAIMGHKG